MHPLSPRTFSNVVSVFHLVNLRGVLIIENLMSQKLAVALPVTQADITKELDSLVGMEGVKEQLRLISQTLEAMKTHNQRHGLKLGRPLHFLIEGAPGGGKKRVAALLGKILQLHGLATSPMDLAEREMEWLDAWLHSRGEAPGSRSSIYFGSVNRLLPNEERRNFPAMCYFWHQVEQIMLEHNVIFSVDQGHGQTLLQDVGLMAGVHFTLKLPTYTDQDYLKYARKYAAKRRFKLAPEAIPVFNEVIRGASQEADFASMRTVESVIEQAMFASYADPTSQLVKGKEYTTLRAGHFKCPSQPPVVAEANPLEELQTLIGLTEVKTRIQELLALVHLEKQRKAAGLPVNPICTHMAFVGAPGTGKTTVARTVARALRDMGFLTKGHLVEVSREELVGQYVGHTAKKTADVIRRAQGGVLFIDEAYSLNRQHESDFGHEAVATLVKQMEDNRDNLTVIFSGYVHEMEQFLTMNPGLKSRIQFEIEFPDYTVDELLAIFHKLCQDEAYELSLEADRELRFLLQKLHQTRERTFANGRTVRSLFERAKCALATRVWTSSHEQSLTLIQPSDIQALRTQIGSRTEPGRIGFRVASA